MGKHRDSNIRADLKDKGGRTPLSHAASRGHKVVVWLLVERDNIKANSKDDYGQMPL